LNLKLPSGGKPDRPIERRDVRTVEVSPQGILMLERKRLTIDLGVDRPLGEYYSRREYLPILFRAAMLLFHGLVFLSMLLGLFYARGSYRKFSILPVIFLYFNMHIFFDLCPRYFVPIFPYMLIFASVTALELYSRRVPAAGR